jgi:hypothetical protein
MTTDGSQVSVREDASDELRTAADLAVSGAAAIGRRRTEEMAAALDKQEAVRREVLGDARVSEPWKATCASRNGYSGHYAKVWRRGVVTSQAGSGCPSACMSIPS